jgi:hypothetical protein
MTDSQDLYTQTALKTITPLERQQIKQCLEKARNKQ